VVTQLERKRLAVDQLQQQLKSYRCVPNTAVLFEQKENLESGLNQLASNTDKLLHVLKENNIQIRNYIDNVLQQFEEFNALRQEVVQYKKVAAAY